MPGIACSYPPIPDQLLNQAGTRVTFEEMPLPKVLRGSFASGCAPSTRGKVDDVRHLFGGSNFPGAAKHLCYFACELLAVKWLADQVNAVVQAAVVHDGVFRIS